MLLSNQATGETLSVAIRSLDLREYLDTTRADIARNRFELDVSYSLIADTLLNVSDFRDSDLQKVVDLALARTTKDASLESAWRALRLALYRQELAQHGAGADQSIVRLVQAKNHRDHAALRQREGNKSEAEEQYKLAVDLYTQLAKESPKADFPQRAVIETTLESLSLVAKDDVKEWKAQIAVIEDMRGHLKKLGTSDKQDSNFEYTLIQVFAALWDSDRAKRPHGLREYVSERALAGAEHIAKLDPKGNEAREAHYEGHQIRADFLFEERQFAEAVLHYQQCLSIYDQLIAADGINAHRAAHLGWTCTLLTRSLMWSEPTEEIFSLALRSLEMREYLDKNRPDAANNRLELELSYEDIAKVMAHWPDVKDADLKKATEFARARTVKDPTLLLAWRALGVLLVRQKQYEEASKALRKPSANNLPERAYDFFFLAMSLEHLGQHDEAKKILAIGSAWVATNQPENELLKTLEQEAIKVVQPTK